MKATAPIRESGPPAGQARRKACSTALRKMRSAIVSIAGTCCRFQKKTPKTRKEDIELAARRYKQIGD